jgi:hypothetical protein
MVGVQEAIIKIAPNIGDLHKGRLRRDPRRLPNGVFILRLSYLP